MRFLLTLALLMVTGNVAPRVSAAQQPVPTPSAPTSETGFGSALDEIAKSAKDGFGDIRGRIRDANDRGRIYDTTVSIPGTADCYIFVPKEGSQYYGCDIATSFSAPTKADTHALYAQLKDQLSEYAQSRGASIKETDEPQDVPDATATYTKAQYLTDDAVSVRIEYYYQHFKYSGDDFYRLQIFCEQL